VAAVFSQIKKSDRFRSLSGRDRESGHAAFERRNPLLEDVLSRIHDSGVDVAELG
jgi:hypothetical protein